MGKSLDNLRNKDIHENCRVFIETEKGLIQEFDGFTTVGTHLFVENINSANITFDNVNDRYVMYNEQNGNYYYRDPVIRKRSEAEVDYLAHVLKIAELNALNKQYRELLAKNRSIEDLRKIVSDFIDNANDVKPFREMNRIWIDFRGREKTETWYAGFTGIISGGTDLCQVGANPSIQLQCKGVERWLELNDIILRADVFAAITKATNDIITQDNVNDEQSTWTNRFSDYNLQQIICECMLETDTVLSYSGAKKAYDEIYEASLHTESTDVASNIPISMKSSNEYYYDNGLFVRENNKIIVNDYNGLTHERNIGDTYFRNNKEYTWEEGDKFFTPRLYIDPNISSTNAFIYEKIIKPEFGLMTMERVSAMSICRQISEIALVEFFNDAMGNFILQEPKYNVLPNLDYIDNSIASKGSLDYFYYNLPNYGLLKYHGQNYVIDDHSLKMWSLSHNEQSIVTFGSMGTGADLIHNYGDELLDMTFRTGHTNISDPNNADLVKLQRRYGYRRRDFKSIIVNNFGGESQSFINAYARACLNRVNAYNYTGALDFSWRPDLQCGRNAMLAERLALGYIIGIDNLYTTGNAGQTGLSMAYIHDIAEQVDSPWELYKNEIDKKQLTNDKVGMLE